MESVSSRLYSDAYPCHRVPTHGLYHQFSEISPIFLPGGAPLSLAVIKRGFIPVSQFRVYEGAQPLQAIVVHVGSS